MLRKDVLVKRPEGTKIYRQRDCVYVYHVTGSEYKKDKKYVVEKRVCIGKMVDDENMNPNDNFYQYYEIVDGNEEEPPRFSDAVQIGAPALLFKIMDELKLSELLRSIHGEEDADLIKDLVSYMIIRETSTMQHYSDFAWSHLISSKKKWDDSKISDFLMMIKTNSSLVTEMLKEAHLPLLTKARYYLPEHDVYGLTKKGTIGDDMTVRYFHIYYDNVRASQEKNEYLKQLVKKEKHLQKKVDEKIRRKEDMVSYEKLFKLKYDNNGYLESYKRNEDEIQKEIDKLGFFVIVTSKEMTASEALNIYRKRDSVEKIFRMLKTGLEYDTFRVHSQDSLESKTYVMFIASIVRNYLFQGLKKISKKEKDKKSYTVPASISELEKITIVKNSKDVYIRRYGLTKKQRSILTQFGVSESYLNKVADRMNLIV